MTNEEDIKRLYKAKDGYVVGQGHEWYAGSKQSAENWANHINRAINENVQILRTVKKRK